MRTSVSIATVLVLVFAGCIKPIEPQTNQSIIEGTVEYYTAPPAIGGETDPSGYILADYDWIEGNPKFSNPRVYVTDGDMEPYISKRVRIAGSIDSLFAGGVTTPLRVFPQITILSIEEIP